MDLLNHIFMVKLEALPFLLLSLLISLTIHEFAHAYVAWKFGDPTAKLLGRVSLNPVKHIDPWGMLLFIIVGFGWAKPVPVNYDNFKNPRMAGVFVSAIGPFSNLLLAFIGTLIYLELKVKVGWVDIQPDDRVHWALYYFLNLFISNNILLCLFNLIPLPPLDGYRIVENLLPSLVAMRMQRIEQWSVFLFFLIAFIPILRNYTLVPLFSLIGPIQTELSKIAYIVLGY